MGSIEGDDAVQSRSTELLRPSSPEALFNQSYQRIVRSLALAGGDLAAAEDATQEAFIQLCVRWKRVSRYDDLTAWVRRVANNKLRNMHRSRVRGAAAALQSLPLKQKIAAVLFYRDGLSVTEVAKAMSVSEGSVSQHLNRARNTLRAKLEVSE